LCSHQSTTSSAHDTAQDAEAGSNLSEDSDAPGNPKVWRSNALLDLEPVDTATNGASSATRIEPSILHDGESSSVRDVSWRGRPASLRKKEKMLPAWQFFTLLRLLPPSQHALNTSQAGMCLSLAILIGR
jgi:hypothetical protein